jgi:hypothetical protein
LAGWFDARLSVFIKDIEDTSEIKFSTDPLNLLAQTQAVRIEEFECEYGTTRPEYEQGYSGIYVMTTDSHQNYCALLIALLFAGCSPDAPCNMLHIA